MMSLREFFTTNSWWGKVIGGFFGFLISGPMGAFFGILVGNFFDKGLALHFSQPYWLYQNEQPTVKAVFLKSLFRIMGHLAKADGRVSEQEIAMASELMKGLRLNKKQTEFAIEYFKEGKSRTFSLKKEVQALKLALGPNQPLIDLLIDLEYQMAMIDGLTQNKIAALDFIFAALNLAPLNQQARFYQDYSDFNHKGQTHQKQTYTRPGYSLDHAYGLLGVSSSASQLEVKRAYRRMMSKHHPDKLMAQGLSEDMIKRANDKTQQIAKAYEDICAYKGW